MSDENKNESQKEDVVDLSAFDTDPERKEGEADPREAEIANLKNEIEKLKNDYLYLRADFDNYRKGVIKERSDLIKYGSERLLAELLDILDNFDRAMAFELTAENMQSFKEGMVLTRNELQKTLSKFGVTPIEAQGQPFDPAVHEALSSEESDSIPPGHVLREFKKGYRLHDRLLRAAQVVVAKEPAKE